MRLAVAIAMLVWAAAAAADLYRWIDPESGSIKYSSYPPPWYGDEARQRHAPRVEHIPAGQDRPAPRAEAGAAESGPTPAAIEAKRAEIQSRIDSIVKGKAR